MPPPTRRAAANLLRWQLAVPFQLAVLAFALAMDDGLIKCADHLGGVLNERSIDADSFNREHPINFTSMETFVESRANWHSEFEKLLRQTAAGYGAVVQAVGYEGPCRSMHPLGFIVMDFGAVSLLVLFAAYFLYEDFSTSFGASTSSVFVAANGFVSVFIVLAVLNLPMIHLMKQAVFLSTKLENCVISLKALQRDIIGYEGFDEFFLHASMWDGQRFGVRDPFMNVYVDKQFGDNLKYAFYVEVSVLLVLVMFLLYRSSVKSLVKWRRAIPSVVCIGVVFPNSDEPNIMWRVGSGCIVDKKRGLILTNWHLFQKMSSTEADLPRVSSSALRRESSGESSVAAVASSDDMPPPLLRKLDSASSLFSNNTTIDHPLFSVREESGVSDRWWEKDAPQETSTPPKISTKRSHLSDSKRYAESYGDLHPTMRIFIGTAARGHPTWAFEAQPLPGVESPSAEFTPYGLDLSVLQITGRAKFSKLVPHDDGTISTGHSFTYAFENVVSTALPNNYHALDDELTDFEIGEPWRLRAGDEKLRLLGYPASGGFTLSVLTGYFTSLSYDWPNKRRGAWLNINTALPHGGSGGAAVSTSGELVGICTQTKGDLTNIRSIEEAKPLIQRAKEVVDRRVQAEKEERRRSRQRSLLTSNRPNASSFSAPNLSCDTDCAVAKSELGAILRRLTSTSVGQL